MAVRITIRNVPEAVRDGLKARAASEGKSMQELLLGELEHIASQVSMKTWLKEVRERKQTIESDVPTSRILWARDMDRK
jgi:hypothetical protein